MDAQQETRTVPVWSRETLHSAVTDIHGIEGTGPVWVIITRWLDRGDGCAVYENQDFGSRDLGDRQFCSYGSTAAQLEVPVPPVRMPDIGSSINWRYQLVAVCKD